MRILLVEDELALRAALARALRADGHAVDEVGTRAEAELEAEQGEHGLVILDRGLPDGDGLDSLRRLRAAGYAVPVLVLTARDAVDERIAGLDSGADDYVVKPFSVRELLARVEAVMRRIRAAPEALDCPARLRTPAGSIDLQRRELHFDDGEQASLSEREAALLSYLAQHAERAISRDEIISRVWNLDPGRYQTRTIDMHVARLRDKLRDNKGNPELIITVRGKGYMLGQRVRPEPT